MSLQKISPASIGEKSKRTSTLDDLVQSSKNLPKRLDDIDTLHLSLNELQKRAYQLRKFNKTANDPNLYTKAHYLLIGKGFTIEEVENDLNALDKLAKSSFKSGPHSVSGQGFSTKSQLNYRYHSGVKPSELESSMYSQKDDDVLATIENSLSTSTKDFDKYVNQNINLDWKEKRKELCDKLSSVLKRDSSPTALTVKSPEKKTKKYTQKELLEKQLIWSSNKSKSIISSNYRFADVNTSKQLDSIVNPNLSYSNRRKFELCAEVIYELNESRQQSKWYKLATVIATLYKTDFGSGKSDQIQKAFAILRDFCENSNDDTKDQIRPGRFTKATNSKLTDFESIKLREKIVLNGRTYLESQFREYLNELYTVNKHPSVTGLTAQQTQEQLLAPNFEKVMFFLERTMKNKQGHWKTPNITLVNGLPLWAILYYLLRAGCYNEAVMLVSKYEDSFQKLEKTFPFFLRSYCESDNKRLSDDLQGRLNNEFNQYFKSSNRNIDPYRYAIYKIIGRCDLARKTLPSIVLSIEDWLWLHLSLVKEDETVEMDGNSIIDGGEHIGTEHYRLVELQKSVLEFGPEAFNISTKNPMYMQTLMLVGLYEDAVKYLMLNNEIDAVHLAITLNYYGLIRVSDESKNVAYVNNLLNVDDSGFKSINFARMIGNYVKKFKFSDPRVACEYLFLICMNDGADEEFHKRQIDTCQESIRDLVLETREFVLLLGKITKTGLRVPGVIEERKSLIHLEDEKSFLYNISEKAAQKANEEGRLIDCILLYQLSEEYDIVLDIVNKLLGDFLNSIDLVNAKVSIHDILNNMDNDGETSIVRLSDNLLKMYNSSLDIMAKTSIKSRITCQKLLDIFEIIKEFSIGRENDDLSNRCVNIMDKIKALDLIPIVTENDISKIRAYIKEFNSADESIMKNIPNLLIIEMACLQNMIGYMTYVGVDEDKVHELKQISKNCMIFAGLIKLRMPREMYSVLINLEINL